MTYPDNSVAFYHYSSVRVLSVGFYTWILLALQRCGFCCWTIWKFPALHRFTDQFVWIALRIENWSWNWVPALKLYWILSWKSNFYFAVIFFVGRNVKSWAERFMSSWAVLWFFLVLFKSKKVVYAVELSVYISAWNIRLTNIMHLTNTSHLNINLLTVCVKHLSIATSLIFST